MQSNHESAQACRDNCIGVLKNVFLSHRTISHSLLGVYLLYKFLYWAFARVLNPSFIAIDLVVASIMIGFTAHLAADSLTEEGIPLFFPLKLRFGIPPIKSMRIKTGRWFEKFVIFPSLAAYLIWFSISYQSKLIDLVKLVTK